MKAKISIIIVIFTLAISAGGYYAYQTFFIATAKKNQTTNSVNIQVAQPETAQNALYFSGTIAPLMVHSITSPIAGTIIKKNFSYGQTVNKGQLLIDINSDKAEQNYREALTTYLKTKNAYISSQAKFASSKSLYKNGLIARNDYESSRNELENNLLSYRQAGFALQNSIQKITSNKIEQKNLYASLTNLSLGDKKVNQALSMQFSNLKLYATQTGVALFSQKSDNGDNTNNNTTIAVGSEIKPGQVIVSIGNLSGISINITVNEMGINKIKVGQRAIITGVAFPDLQLKGYVAQVGIEAKPDSTGGSLPVFPVKIVVPKLTVQQQKQLHIGMSAQVELLLTSPNMIMVPISAVQQKNNASYVTVLRHGIKQSVKVTTGLTTLNKVAIVSGLKPGDNIVGTHSTQ
jgi:multidrug efflux pump subunit AcrA (membrane-fusion protein)